MPAPGPATLTLLAQKANGDLRWRRTVRDALDKAGSVSAAAKKLGIGKRTLQRLIEETPELLVGIELRVGPGNPEFGPGYRPKRKPSTKRKRGN